MNQNDQGFRIFILGAGFSKLAGLPLGTELFQKIRERVVKQFGYHTKLNEDLNDFIDYRKKCDGVDLESGNVDLEEFLSYLDIEHFLGLRGKDTWSKEGNESQILIKRFIGKIIQDQTPTKDNLPEAYYEFARKLSTRDRVIIFNYDVILERALDHVGKPYRLFPARFEKIGSTLNTVDSSKEEVVILKMHGSLDWFNNQDYLERLETSKNTRFDYTPKHRIFNDLDKFKAKKIVDGPRNDNDPLNHIYRIAEVDKFYSENYPSETPFILSPSHAKVVYASLISDFWRGLGKSGGLNLGLSIIGYSLPKHDEYARISLYQMIDNYQNCYWDERLLGHLKDNVKIVDHRTNKEDISYLKERYKFIDQGKLSLSLNGFDSEAVDFLFRNCKGS